MKAKRRRTTMMAGEDKVFVFVCCVCRMKEMILFPEEKSVTMMRFSHRKIFLVENHCTPELSANNLLDNQ
jgi:hypothetical protein